MDGHELKTNFRYSKPSERDLRGRVFPEKIVKRGRHVTLNPSVEINTNDLLESTGGMTSPHNVRGERKKGEKLAHTARKEVR